MTIDELLSSHGIREKDVANLMQTRKECMDGKYGTNVILLYRVRFRGLKVRDTYNPSFLLRVNDCHAYGNIHENTCVEKGRWIVVDENMERTDSCSHGKIIRADAIERVCTEYDLLAYNDCYLWEKMVVVETFLGEIRKRCAATRDGVYFKVAIKKQGSSSKRDTYFVERFSEYKDFVSYLRGDLSGADLLACEDIILASPLTNTVNLSGALVSGAISKKYNLPFDPFVLQSDKIKSFTMSEQYEKNEVALAFFENERPFLHATGEAITTGNDTITIADMRMYRDKYLIHYISDLHLLHRLAQLSKGIGTFSWNDVRNIIRNVVRTLVNGCVQTYLGQKRILLICGDVVSDFKVFKVFVEELHRAVIEFGGYNLFVIFTLGNHELWDFPGYSFFEIVAQYRDLLTKNGMYLLQNSILYTDDDDYDCFKELDYDFLCHTDVDTLHNDLRAARVIFFGGIGFSGYNMEFNADNGIYRNAMDRETEIAETEIFESLYNKVTKALASKNVVIATHTPMNCWCKNVKYENGFIYVSGHTHRNVFYDDGITKIYADNQIGYSKRKISTSFKWFELDNRYDYFADYPDGIHSITAKDYNLFYRGKNIAMTFNQDAELYMLKKHGYYCFIRRLKSGMLAIMNGGIGKSKGLPSNSIQYYYDNMDKVVSYIEEPLSKYTAIQQQISSIIKKIGGDGTIHGAIVDINFENHVYVNPVDLTITGYWASDIIFKVVYPSVPALLEQKCPLMFNAYQKLLTEGKESGGVSMIVKSRSSLVGDKPQEYLSTDIYRASREIKKMQKLQNNVLSTWVNFDYDHEKHDARDRCLLSSPENLV